MVAPRSAVSTCAHWSVARYKRDTIAPLVVGTVGRNRSGIT